MKKSLPGYAIQKMQIRFEQDVVTARQKTRKISEFLNFENQDQARLATAVSELARNAYQYANGGHVEFFFSEKDPQTLFICVSDEGKGIADLDLVLGGSYVSPTGMGVGLLGSKKLMDSFDVVTSPSGTRVTIGKQLPKRVAKIKLEDLADIAQKMADRGSDSAFEEIQNQNRDLLNALEELRASKEELADLNRELAETNRGVVALYAELDEKAASLQRANEVKTSFLSNMTHEFRTPLSSVISLTRILLQEIDGPLNEEQRKQVNYIRQSGESLLGLVNDLLDLAKVEAGKVSILPSHFQVEDLLGGLRGMFRPVMDSLAVDLKFSWDSSIPELDTDEAKLSQILRNLISNAMKFTEAGSIEVHATSVDNDFICFVVSDSGIGIDHSNLETIFEDFGQVQSKMQKTQKGTGLGLPLSRRLARLLGGDLTVKSELGKGSVFTVLIPRKYLGASEGLLVSRAGEDKAGFVEIANEAIQSKTKFNVLLIDDDEASRYVLKDMLNSEISANYVEAADGRQALECLRKLTPDIVFLDLTMPNLDGFNVLEAIRSQPNYADLPIVINTAKKLSEEEIYKLHKDAVAVLSKERTDDVLAVRDLRQALVKAGFDFKNMRDTL